MEIWKDIKGFEGKYQVSTYGKIKTFGRTFPLPHGGTYSTLDRLLSIHVVGKYCQITLSDNGKPKMYKVHRLVACAFIPNPENKPQVNHKDGNKENNHVSNLEWCTSSENHIHAFKTGLRKTEGGFNHHHSKTVLHLETGIYYGSMMEAAKVYGFNYVTLNAQLRGRNPNNSKMIVA